jgi:hypothetical protein
MYRSNADKVEPKMIEIEEATRLSCRKIKSATHEK